ncbi:MAG: glyoxalase [Caulobacter sp.]|nr:glyoxalase [Caulobacter sp.]
MSLFTALDHVALAVRDLDVAGPRLAAMLGRSAEWRGAGSGGEHLWFQLGNTALDVVTGGAVAQRLKSGEGLWGMALTTPDLAKARHRLERLGVSSSDVIPIATRQGDETRRWPTSVVDAKAAHGATLFLVEPQALPPALFTADEASAVSGLDHIVIRTPNPERAIALYGGRLGLEMRLDRSNPEWGSRLLFFRLGDLVVEIAADLKAPVTDEADSLWGLSWRVPDVDAARERMAGEGFDVSEARTGRKPGTKVFTVRDAPAGVPTLILGSSKDS